MIDLSKTGGKIIALAIAAAIVGLVVWGGLTLFGNGLNIRRTATLERGQAGAAVESGKDAIGTVAGAGRRDAGIDDQTRENDHAIRSAEGASAPVSDAADRAGRDSLCKRAAYRGSADCVQQPDPK